MGDTAFDALCRQLSGMAAAAEATRQNVDRLAGLVHGMAQARAANVPVGGEGRRGGRTIVLGDFKRLTKFAKGEDAWAEFRYDFLVILGAADNELVGTIRTLELEPGELDVTQVWDLVLRQRPDCPLDFNRASRELFEALVYCTEGEAKTMIRNIDLMDGFQAWHRLHRYYNRRTFARSIRTHLAALQPRPAANVHEVIPRIVEWEHKWDCMTREHAGQQLPPQIRMGVLATMCPPEFQDMILQHADETDQDYERMKQRIVAWASNKAASVQSGPVPMDVGRVTRRDEDEGGGADVDAVGWNTQCFNCQGWGHRASECPSEKRPREPKGGGKGGAGQAGSRGAGPDAGKKGTGKGFQGACFQCGKTGHRAAECRGGRRVGAVDGEENQDNDRDTQANAVEEVGTVWTVGAVDVNRVETAGAGEDAKKKTVEITIDSGAGASCWPASLLPEVPMQAKDKGVRFRAANGTELKYYGTKSINFRTDGGGACGMKFHVTDATKPLASAAAIARMGNRVVIQSGPGKSYVENVATGRRIALRETGGTFVFDAECLAGPGFGRRG